MVYLPTFIEESLALLYTCNSNSKELDKQLEILKSFVATFPEPTVLGFVKCTNAVYHLSHLYDAALDENKIKIVGLFESILNRKLDLNEDAFNAAVYKILFSLNTNSQNLLNQQLICLELAVASGKHRSRKVPGHLIIIPKLVALLSHPREDIVKNSIGCLGYFFSDDLEEILELSFHCGILNHFNLLFHRNIKIVSKYIWLVSNTATSEAGADIIIEKYSFIIPYIRHFMKSSKKEISYWSFKLMGNLFGYSSDGYQLDLLIAILKPESTLQMVIELARDHKCILLDPVESDFYLDILANILPYMASDMGDNDESDSIDPEGDNKEDTENNDTGITNANSTTVTYSNEETDTILNSSPNLISKNHGNTDDNEEPTCSLKAGDNKGSNANEESNGNSQDTSNEDCQNKEPTFNSDITKRFLQDSLDLDICRLLTELKQNPETDVWLKENIDKVTARFVKLYKYHLNVDVDVDISTDEDSVDMETP